MNPTPTPLTDAVMQNHLNEPIRARLVRMKDHARALERRNAELREAEKKSRELAGQFVAFIKVNALSGKFRHAIYSEVEAALQPFIERLTAQQALAVQEGGEG